MAITSGSRLGPYEVVAPLGAGGMGEVYRARDTRLERTVAVKVLPQHLSSSPEVRQRFEREAKTISQLSHPHICALYDVGNQDGVEYLVMEYLEGETLAERLLKGSLPTEQTLRFGIEIADALDKAHRQGIVHRDLKPGNVMLTKSGVKLLDFGLAKAVQAPVQASGMTALPTVASSPLTQEGTILGTFQYMAPEQLEGKEADARSDIFAFGAVLYEMATGKKAFSGASQASLIGAILHTEPQPISAVQPTTPPALDRIVKTCLAKDPEERWQTARDVMLGLRWIAEAGSQAGAPAPVVSRPKNRELLAWSLFALSTLAAVALAAGYLRLTPTPVRTLRASIMLPEKRFLDFAALSPDGSQLAFVAGVPGGKRQLWARSLDGLSSRPLDGTEDADLPFWSPDSRTIAFFADGKLMKIEATGGSAVALCDAAPNGLGGSWSREGVILFAHPGGGLFRIPASGGSSTPATELASVRHETTHRYPYFLPDGRHFLYMAANLAGAPDDPANVIRLGSTDSKEDRVLIPAHSNTIYVPASAGSTQGYLVFDLDGTLFAQRFDTKHLTVSSERLPISERILRYELFWRYSVFAASDNGMLVYGSAAATPSHLLWFDRFGRQTDSLGEPSLYRSRASQGIGRLRISPDGRRLAATVFDPSKRAADVWVYDLTRGIRTRFTSGTSDNTDPVWSPDGEQIVFQSDRKHQGDLYRKSTEGGSEEPILEGEGQRTVDDWSPDGRFLALEFREPRGERKVSLLILALDGKGTLTTFLRRRADFGDARFSPDGRWLAYTSEESGRNEIYAAPFPGPGGQVQLSASGGVMPRWRRDGKELFYLSADLRLMSVEIRTSGAALVPGVPKVLFEPHPFPSFFDVAPDGQRFLLIPSGVEESPPITLVQNWASSLRKQ